jgi:hypothetical protein
VGGDSTGLKTHNQQRYIAASAAVAVVERQAALGTIVRSSTRKSNPSRSGDSWSA